MPLSKEDQEDVKKLLAGIRSLNPDDPDEGLKKLGLLVRHAGTVDRVIAVVNAFGTVGGVLKYLLIGIVGINVALLTLSGQLKTFLGSLITWAGR